MNPFKLKRRDSPILLGILALAFSFWLIFTENSGVHAFLERVEYLIYDLRLQAGFAFNKTEKPPIIIVDIDEKSLAREGRWPWSRQKMRILVEKLFDAKTLLVGFDIVFSEPERNPVGEILDKLPQDKTLTPLLEKALKPLKPYFDADERFGEALEGRDVVLGFLFHREHHSSGVLPLSVVNVPGRITGTLTNLPAYTGNISEIQRKKTPGGFLTNFRDLDGAVRRSPLVVAHQNLVYPALSLEMARHYLLADKVELVTAKEGRHIVVEGVKIGPMQVQTDAIGQVLVPYRGGPRTFTTLSASDILAGRVNPKLLENSLVLIGTSALGLGDLIATPVSPVYPGVEVHASILAGLLDQHFHSEPSWGQGAELVLMLLTGLILVICLPRLGPLMMVVVGVGLFTCLVLLNFWLWVGPRLALHLSVPLISVFLILMVNLAYGFFVENRRKQEIKGMFGQYVPPQHIEEMANEDNPQFGFQGEAREMSVLFSDIRDFTTLSEPLSATELKVLLNDFLTPMTEVIFKHGGTIDKYVGDMVMAFWGAPLRDPNHAEHALCGAREMLEAARRVSLLFQAKGFPPIHIGIGINTGFMNIGDMGSSFRRSYTVLGDAVNLASRLEGLTKHYGVPMLVGEQTALSQRSFLMMKIDKVRVKGKQQPVTIYQPLGALDTIEPILKKKAVLFEAALEHYLWGRWLDAKMGFESLQAQFGQEKLFSVYLERITRLSQENKEWDGVYTMLEK